MSIVTFQETWPDRSVDGSSIDDTKANRQWLVVTDNKYDTAHTVATYGLTAGILPNRYYSHPDNPYLTARRLNVQSQTDSPLHWVVVVEYSSAPIKDADKDKETTPDPINRKARIKWTTSLYREAVDKDRDGEAILNSAGDYFDPPIERDRSNWTATVTKAMPTVPTWLLDYNNCPINASGFTVDGVSVEAKKARLTQLDISEPQEENGTAFRTVTLTLEFKKEGWTSKILDQGLRTKDADGKLLTIMVDTMDADGNATGELIAATSPRLLDGAGNVLDDPTPDTAEFMDYELYDEKDFSALPLT